MILTIGGTSEPCPPCKIILNGGFIAALAPLLAVRSSWHNVRVAATRLGVTVSAYTGMLASMGMAVRVVGDWSGCDEAKAMLRWMEEDGSIADASERVATMWAWIGTYEEAIADLAAGKLPT